LLARLPAGLKSLASCVENSVTGAEITDSIQEVKREAISRINYNLELSLRSNLQDCVACNTDSFKVAHAHCRSLVSS
jgi:hypothetical protein